MNCNRFRFLIQQQFDMELAVQDEQMLESHLDSCQSCARFQHQLDQVVQAATDLPLPEEVAPTNLESLARMIMQQLPQPKGGVFSFFGGLFGGGKPKEAKPKLEPQPDTQSGSRFPHVKRAQPIAEQARSSGRQKVVEQDEQRATATRLRGLAKLQSPSGDQSQAGGRSLGEKFGMVSAQQEAPQEEAPLTFADAIRKKLSQDKQTAQQAEAAAAQAQAFQAGSFGQTGDLGQPPPAPGVPGAGQWEQPGDEGWSAPQTRPPAGGWSSPTGGSDSWGGPQAQQPAGSGSGWSEPQQPGGSGWTAGQPAPPGGSQWSGAPQGGTWDEPKPAQPGPSQWSGAPAGGSWGEPTTPLAPSTPVQPQPGANTWNQPPAGSGWGGSAPQGGAWEEPASGWGGAPKGGTWEEPAGAASGWSGAPKGGAWEEPAGGSSGWSSGAGTSPQSGWSSPAAAPGQADSGWSSQPASPSPPQDQGWGSGAGGSREAPASTPSPAPATGGWGQQAAADGWKPPSPAGGPSSPLTGWSSEAEQIQTGMWQAFSPGEGGLGAPSQAAKPKPTGEPSFAPPKPPAQPGADRWDVPIQERMKQPAQPETGADRWDVPIQERQQQPPVQQPPAQQAAPPAQPAADRWDVPIQERMKMQQSGQQQAAQPQPAAPGGIPAESIMNRLSNILGDNAGEQPGSPAATGAPAQPQPAPAQPGADRWDVPIQERRQQQQAAGASPQAASPGSERWDVPIQERAQAQGPPQPQGQPGLAADRWDLPIQERMRQGQAAPAAPGPPAPQPAAQQQGQGLFNVDDAAMDRLFSENLGVVEPARPGPMPGATSPPAPAAPPSPQAPPPGALAAPGPATPAAPPITPVAPGPASAPAPVAPAPVQAGAPQAPPQPQSGGLFNITDDAMDRLFAENLGVTEQARTATTPPTPPPAPVQPQQGAWQKPTPPTPSAAAGWEQTSAPAGIQAGGWGQASAQAPPPAPAPPPAQAPTPAPAPAQPPPAPAAPASQQGAWGQAPPAAPAVGQQPAPAAAQPGGLFNITDDVMDQLFSDNLGVKDAGPQPAQKVNVNEAVQSIRTAAGTSASAPVRVEGMGRLSATDSSADAGSGKIASIGKFLLDQQDLTKIGSLTSSDLTDTKMRILTMEAAQELQSLLKHIGTQPGVVGSVIVGHDGILIANSMPKDVDPESIGVWALAVYLNTDNSIKKLGHNNIHQVVCRTPRGYLIIADFGGGILVTIADGSETEMLIPLMRSITQLVAR